MVACCVSFTRQGRVGQGWTKVMVVEQMKVHHSLLRFCHIPSGGNIGTRDHLLIEMDHSLFGHVFTGCQPDLNIIRRHF